MKKNYLTRKEEIILTTVSLIHEMGIQQVSMKEIGNREGVSEASLYKHFKNKEELLNGVLDHYIQYDDYINSTFQKNQDMEGNILKYFSIYAEYYGNYKEITSFVRVYDTLLYDVALRERVQKMEEDKFSFISTLVKGAQDNGEISKEIIEYEEMSYILLGTFYEIISMWRMQEYIFDLKSKVNEVIGNIVSVYAEKRR